ncbi:MAG: replication protein dnaD [Oscillospiraceae bacterium]|nr:replication protein dnaD [Oscillospiraceae bacterium]
MPANTCLPGGIVAMTAEAADRLIKHGAGDAALLYLALLRGENREGTRKLLRWTAERLDAAGDALTRLELISGEAAPEPPPSRPALEEPPEYTSADLARELEGTSPFAMLVPEVERRLGKFLSPADLKTLYLIYDYYALPAEVVMILVSWCVEETERKYGEGRRPRLPQIKKEAERWREKGVDSAEAAEEYLKRQAFLRTREGSLLPVLQITGRPPIDRERDYLASWVEMGFGDDAVRLAYERTIMKKQSLNWSYMNSILKRWHEKGLHTVAQVEAGDSERKRAQDVEKQASTASALRQDADWLEQFMRNQEAR